MTVVLLCDAVCSTGTYLLILVCSFKKYVFITLILQKEGKHNMASVRTHQLPCITLTFYHSSMSSSCALIIVILSPVYKSLKVLYQRPGIILEKMTGSTKTRSCTIIMIMRLMTKTVVND